MKMKSDIPGSQINIDPNQKMNEKNKWSIAIIWWLSYNSYCIAGYDEAAGHGSVTELSHSSSAISIIEEVHLLKDLKNQILERNTPSVILQLRRVPALFVLMLIIIISKF